jgi:segregation and condensation protein B
MRDNLHRILEAILFASDAPLTQQKCKELISGTGIKEIREAVNYLNQQYETAGSALKIIEIAGGYLIVTREEYAPFLQKLYKGRSSARLTQRALETLSIVAYKQPITKQEIESIRGVNVDAVMKTLLERNLITIEGRQKAPGSPLLYGTTKYFLEYFALNALEALPKLKEIDELLKADDKFLESLDQVAVHQLAPESLGLKNPEELSGEAAKPNVQTGKQIPLIVFEQTSPVAAAEDQIAVKDDAANNEGSNIEQDASPAVQESVEESIPAEESAEIAEGSPPPEQADDLQQELPADEEETANDTVK